jgi:hypothetical protein
MIYHKKMEDEEKIKLKFSIGTNWTGNNISTLLSWITISAYNIECLDYAIDDCRTVIRRNTIFALFTTTLAGTLNITQFGLIPNEQVNITIKILLTLLTFAVAINAGRIKIYQYQESMEDYIKVKQDWTAFVVTISTEMQLPVYLRRDALYLIETYKEKYLDLLKHECEIAQNIKEKIKQKMQNDIESGLIAKESNLHPALMSKTGIKISDIVFDIAYWEGLNLMIVEKDETYRPNIPVNNLYNKITTKILHKKKMNVETEIEEMYFSDPIKPAKGKIEKVVRKMTSPKVKKESVPSELVAQTEDVKEKEKIDEKIDEKPEQKTNIFRVESSQNDLDIDIYKEDVKKELNKSIAKNILHALSPKKPSTPSKSAEIGTRIRTLS